ncbi:MAG: T9SS type A sorting domain-containing protein, partial [Flavobacteriaceae bacterium]|nr:T9SS type A sorting domain-containing protein [Flavobacteriaceae bacterium]
ISSKLDLRLYRAAAYTAGETPSDGLRLKFGAENTNAITSKDAPKFYNQDENLASSNDERLWSIESRALPEEGESIPLFTNAYRTTDYVFEVQLTEVNDIKALLRDHFTGIDTELENNESTLYAFNINPNDAQSSATDRFEIVFEELLSSSEVAFGNGFVLFPNPAQGEITLATKGITGEEVTLQITNVLGQAVYRGKQIVNTNGHLTVDTTPLSQGVYVLKLIHIKGQFTTKFIKK